MTVRIVLSVKHVMTAQNAQIVRDVLTVLIVAAVIIVLHANSVIDVQVFWDM